MQRISKSNSPTMIKRVLTIVAYTVVFATLIVALLFIFKTLFLDHLVHTIMKIRGTAEYEGEEKGREVWNIVVGMIVPEIFVLTFALVTFFNRKKFKANKQ